MEISSAPVQSPHATAKPGPDSAIEISSAPIQPPQPAAKPGPDSAPVPNSKPTKAPPNTLRRTLLVHNEEHTRIPVRLSTPSDAEECPLTLTLIKDDELPFVPGVTYSKSYPHIKKITLPCDHSFGIMSLLFHFAQNNTRCPMCRNGNDARLDTRSIPTHFRRAIINKIRQADHESALAEIEEDERVARQYFTDFIRDLESFVTHVYVTVYMVLDDASKIELFQCKMMLVVRLQNVDDSFHFGLSGPHRRALMTNLSNINVATICVGFSIKEGDSEPREVSLSDPFSIAHNGPPRTIPCSMGILTVTSLANDSNAFRSLLWSVNSDDLFANV